MAAFIWGLMCKSLSESEDGEDVIGGEIASADFPCFPVTPYPFHVVSRYRGEPNSQLRTRVRILEPAGQAVLDTGWSEHETDERGLYLQRLVCQNVTFPQAGAYCLEFWLDGDLVHSAPVDLRVRVNGEEHRRIKSKLVWGLMCDTVRDEGGVLTIYGPTCAVHLPRFPFEASGFYTVSRYDGEPGSIAHVRSRLVAPSGRSVADSGLREKPLNRMGQLVYAVKFGPVILPEAGSYSLEFWLDGSMVHSAPLVILQAPD